MHTLVLASPDVTRRLGVALAAILRRGDLVVLTGDLGAGKTTLTQGIGDGLDVRGPITSPTFVIARTHPSLGTGPALVHVDAYRLGGALELDDLDLDSSLEESVAVVEWGRGLAEVLSQDRLEIVLQDAGPSSWSDPEQESVAVQRTATITAVGRRWTEPGARAQLDALVSRAAVDG